MQLMQNIWIYIQELWITIMALDPLIWRILAAIIIVIIVGIVCGLLVILIFGMFK